MKNFQILNKNLFHNIIYFFLPLFLLILALILFSLDTYFKESLLKIQILPSPLPPLTVSRYPILKQQFSPLISAKGAVIVDPETKVVLFAKNPNLRFSSASTTKIMTAITALQAFSLNQEMVVFEHINDGSVIGLKIHERMTFENLLYGMLLPSGNDAALTIAQNYQGGLKEFIKKMNQNAKDWYLYNTHFEDPTGLDDGNFTTSVDLARLASVAKKNPTFSKVVSTKNKIITDVSGTEKYDLENLNKLLGIDGIDGIKTGYTEEAGQVLVTSKTYFDPLENKKRSIIVVVMGSQDRFSDTQNLLNLASGNITYLSIHP